MIVWEIPSILDEHYKLVFFFLFLFLLFRDPINLLLMEYSPKYKKKRLEKLETYYNNLNHYNELINTRNEIIDDLNKFLKEKFNFIIEKLKNNKYKNSFIFKKLNKLFIKLKKQIFGK